MSIRDCVGCVDMCRTSFYAKVTIFPSIPLLQQLTFHARGLVTVATAAAAAADAALIARAAPQLAVHVEEGDTLNWVPLLEDAAVAILACMQRRRLALIDIPARNVNKLSLYR